MGNPLPVNARLVKANNQWGDGPLPMIKVSLYFETNNLTVFRYSL
ncbi:hypothetical protein SZ39_3325 [Bacillus mycoides]|nr:hypothetical protein SZ39_3325 [Bacillus mycoides]